MKNFLAAAFALAWLAAPQASAEAVLVAESDGRFSRPHDAVLSPDGTLLYLADLGNDRIAVLDAETLQTVGEIGTGALSSPHDVAIDGRGRLLVADSGNDRIAFFALDGAEGRQLESLSGGISSPNGVQPLADGRVLVTDSRGGALVVFRDGKPVRRLEDFGDGRGFSRPHDVILDGQGRIVLTDPGHDRLLLFDTELEPIGKVGYPASGLNEPKYLDSDPEGFLYVADELNNRIVIFAPDLHIVDSFGSEALNAPEGIAVRGAFIWVVDTDNHRVLKYRRTK